MVVDALRTPIGKFGGMFKDISAPNLGAIVIKELLGRLSLTVTPKDIDLVIMGQVLQAGQGQAPSRQAALYGGLPYSCRALTIREECGSSLAAISMGDSMIKAGKADVLIAGGMENMSQAPHLLKRSFGKNFGHQELLDSMIYDGLKNAYNKYLMGRITEIVAKRYGVTRKEQDEFALLSFKRAMKAASEGIFRAEMIPMQGSDQGIRNTSLEELGKLKPVFLDKGTITAGNASQISDGAAALVLMSGKKAQDRGIKPLVRVVGEATNALSPQHFPLAPIGAIRKLLKKSGLTIKDIDLFEVNEAFAAVPIIIMREIGIPQNKLNIYGGAIGGLGHPLGASGARISTTLINALVSNNYRYGVCAICIGGGQAIAILYENIF